MASQGSGKTSLAERISIATGIRWHSIDELTWEPGWIEVREDEQRRRIDEICSGDRWVLDTAYERWLDWLAVDGPRNATRPVTLPSADSDRRLPSAYVGARPGLAYGRAANAALNRN